MLVIIPWKVYQLLLINCMSYSKDMDEVVLEKNRALNELTLSRAKNEVLTLEIRKLQEELKLVTDKLNLLLKAIENNKGTVCEFIRNV